MTLLEYKEAALTTLIDKGNLKLNLFHMRSGMFTECGEFLTSIKAHIAYGKELDVVNLCEEMGDYMWFNNGYIHLMNLSPSWFQLIDTTYLQEGVDMYPIDDMIEISMELMDKYNYLTPNDVIIRMMKIIQSLRPSITFSDIMIMNIRKLDLRAKKKGTLSPFDAINRNVEEERKLLEEKFHLTT